MTDEDKDQPAKSMHFEEQVTTPNKKMFRRHAVEFEAVRFTGENFDEIREFVGTRPYNMQNFNPIGTYLIPAENNRDAEGELWDADAKVWRPVYMNEWIVQQDEGWLSVTDEWIHVNCMELNEEMMALIREMERPKSFEEDLTALLNHHSMENLSGTPDFILANYLHRCLETYNATIMARAEWRGESVELPALLGLLEQNRKDEDLEQGGFEAGDTQGPDEVYAEGSMDSNDGKEVPLVIYTDGQRNEVGKAKIAVTPGEVHVTGTITSAIPQFADPEAAYSIAEKDSEPKGQFERYLRRGLTDNG